MSWSVRAAGLALRIVDALPAVDHKAGADSCDFCQAVSDVNELVALASRASQMEEAVQRCCDESDYCYACDCHPSHGHADSCPLTRAALGKDDKE